MTNLTRYRATDLPQLMEKINKYGIGLDSYFDHFFSQDQSTNYPPYNLIHLSNHESRLEVALAGFKKDEVKVYTEYGKLFVEGKVEEKEEPEYAYRGLSKRNFSRSWQLSEDVEIKHVDFEDGLLNVLLGKVVPEHHARKDYM
tara:strand:+ start:521 stop:949 length:429 start_codon:yes stop_codon:yes gene_type:complete